MVWTVKILEKCLNGMKVTIRTDHEALRWVIIMTDAKGRTYRWILRFSASDYEVVHHAGINYEVADSLSMVTTTGGKETSLDDDIPFLILSMDGK